MKHTKHILIPIFVVVFCLQLLYFDANAQQTYTVENQEIIIPNTAFKTGEELFYEIKYGAIKGGIAHLKINLFQVGYDYYYHVKAVAKTAGVTLAFVKIQDTYESYFDIATGLPIKAIRDIREQSYRHYDEVLYDRTENQVHSIRYGTHDVPENVLDILSAFYYARKYLFDHIDKSDTIVMNTFFVNELFPIKIQLWKEETIRTKVGKIDCLLFVPIIEEGSAFEDEKDLRIWVTNDSNFMPVKIKAKLIVGSVRCELTKYVGLKNDYYNYTPKE